MRRVCPVFQVSSVTGAGLANLRQFLNLLPVYKKYPLTDPAEFQITDHFSVPGVGTVGTLQFSSDVIIYGGFVFNII